MTLWRRQANALHICPKSKLIRNMNPNPIDLQLYSQIQCPDDSNRLWTDSKRACLGLLAASTALWLAAAVQAQTPTVVSAYGEYDSGTLIQYVDVTYSELMNAASVLNPANYSIAGYTITGAAFFTNNIGVATTTNVILTVNKQITGNFTLDTTNITSASGIPLAVTSVAVTEDPLNSIDITSPSAATPTV